MYYRVSNDGSILDYSRTKFHEDCVYTDKDIIVAWDGNAYIEGTEPPEPAERVNARIQKQLTDTVQHVLDSKAQELNYDNCLSVCSYIDTGVAKFDAEGRAFRAWRSAVWAKSYEILAEIVAGTRANPSEEELMAMLPELEISYS